MSDLNDIASPIDLKNLQDATQWALEANLKRPSRSQFFQLYTNELVPPNLDHFHVLDIASGPGFIAETLLLKHPHLKYTALDFSDAMHQLAKQRLINLDCPQVQFVLADFKQAEWYKTLEKKRYDLIIIHQALHELRHKRYAIDFHRVVSTHLLKQNGCYAVCDHLAKPDGNMQNQELYMTRQEHVDTLTQAGFQRIEHRLFLEGLQLFLTQTH